MVKEDLILAQQIVSGSKSNLNGIPYHNQSFIYKTSNEKINEYQQFLNNRNKVLSVIASGNQIINSILGNCSEIDAYDISKFPKYFLYLKLKAIENISKEDFVTFFFQTKIKDNEYYDSIYEKIRTSLSVDDKIFWDGLFNFFDWQDIYDSTLFSSEPFSFKEQVITNKYLQDDNYYKVRDKLGKLNLNTIVGDICDIIATCDNSYDLVNLSSIIYYGKYKNYEYYKNFIEKIPLNNGGVSITYLYDIDVLRGNEFFQDRGFSLLQFEDDRTGVMVYKKNKKLY